ncbi:MAG: ABC transporter permease, partial [Hyphomicrobiales bacterium]
MAVAEALHGSDIVRTVDGTPLRVRLRQAERRERLKAIVLIAPLFLFVVVTFLVPILVMLFNAIHDPDIKNTLPNTVGTLSNWDGKEVPGEPTFEALARDLKQAQKDKTVALLG